jgi:hypothetical protein
MISDPSQAAIEVDRAVFDRDFGREPFGFRHNLHELDLFAPDALIALAEAYETQPRDSYVAGSAPAPDTEFYSLPEVRHTPLQALRLLDASPARILLKRPENHNKRFRLLLETLFAQLVSLQPALRGNRLARLEATILISSAATTTPFHFDPEINCFAQIEGDKTYHVYSPSVLDEPDLERFYVRGVVDISQADLARCDPAQEHVFRLAPGLGLQHPQNAPHWVQTVGARSVSYSFVLVTEQAQALGYTRSFNHYLRKIGVSPGHPSRHPALDAAKARAMRTLIPVRKTMIGH